MKQIDCPHCGNEINMPPPPSFCIYCGGQMNNEHLTIDPNNKENSSHSTTNHTSKFTMFIIPILVIVAFVVGLFIPKLFTHSENEMATTMTKSQLTSFFSAADEVDMTDTDLMFKEVKSKLMKKESEGDPGKYVVTGQFTHDETTYTFTHDVFVYDGIYFYYHMPTFEE